VSNSIIRIARAIALGRCSIAALKIRAAVTVRDLPKPARESKSRFRSFRSARFNLPRFAVDATEMTVALVDFTKGTRTVVFTGQRPW
jgi:hypothetical protein